MIGWLSGTVRDLNPVGSLLLVTQGVGYELQVSLQTLCGLREGQQASFYVHTHVREDQLQLFGFRDAHERQWFRRLNQISGIGARMALNLMSGMPVDALRRAIEEADDAAIARTPGIGKKTAQRLILELRGKLPGAPDGGRVEAADAGHVGERTRRDVHSALVNLGYRPALVERAMRDLAVDLDFEQAFRQALKALA